MSRIGKNPINLPDGIEVKVDKNLLTISGSKGSLSQEIHSDIKIKVEDDQISLIRPNDSKHFKALHGLYRSLVANMVEGVHNSYQKKLEIVGVGYKAEMKTKRLVMQLGYSHPIIFIPPDGIDIVTENPTSISITGIDKELVGQVAAKIRSFRPPEPYKGKGIKYAGEHIRRKAGKTAA